MTASFYESPEERSSGLFFCLWVTGAWADRAYWDNRANRACWANKADRTNRVKKAGKTNESYWAYWANRRGCVKMHMPF